MTFQLSTPQEHVKQVLYCWYFASVTYTDNIAEVYDKNFPCSLEEEIYWYPSQDF